MTSAIANNALRFIILVLVQVLICNNINFLGYINPYIYILFILIYPVGTNRLGFLFISFLLGMTVDLFLDSGGVHAAASVALAYSRPVFLKFAFGTLYEYNNLKFSLTDLGNLLAYIIAMTFLHHLILFSLEIFNISHILLILKKTLFSGLFTSILCIILIQLFSKRK
ncbi:rod shape-determining protein MreD [Winogradskyella maritima]|uniref:Rod shape-determining protein MreD n=1 Tax=Winogradskyella maritima TaxID=1517766 RepID=A0ABV8AGX5_9FLAO|nr:rod shape-determining protein MreD [Winogradskyella maritima]